MRPFTFMLIAGEPSGDLLAAELLPALKEEVTQAQLWYTDEVQPLRATLEARFFGAGGPRMREAGVELALDMTQHSVIGLSDALKSYLKFKRIFARLYRLALDRQPDAIICVDFSGFNRRFARAIKRYVRSRRGWFHGWNPRLIQYVSPQVWASREGRAYQLARDFDLLLSIFPFERDWYAARVPDLRVEFIGHPMVDRYAGFQRQAASRGSQSPLVVVLPGSRPNELKRHLPVMLEALRRIRSAQPGLRARMVLPDESLVQQAKSFVPPSEVETQCGGLAQSLGEAAVAIASTGTVTLECARFGVPTVAIYKTSWSTYWIARQIVQVKFLAMPNLLAGEEVFPEFVQHKATAANLSRAALELLDSTARREQIKARLVDVVASLGAPGASGRAARAIVSLYRA